MCVYAVCVCKCVWYGYGLLSVCLSACLPACLSVCLSDLLSVSLYVSLPACLPASVGIYVCMYVYVCLFMSVCVYVCTCTLMLTIRSVHAFMTYLSCGDVGNKSILCVCERAFVH